ncbi:sugar transferase [Suttonella sp. R2A3]|uniref:sugar transferase n=1 Tax=Suttonella sp. R2A3 TaxID=2908648 RepID=UPI001F384535|nr:sugar transferase [Suttonella sp. R2A3]UJF25308.1 sugar transferase [Suttonella sp. R2A3]
MQLLLGLVLCVWLPSLFFWWEYFPRYFTMGLIVSLAASAWLLLATLISRYYFNRFPGISAATYILPLAVFWLIVTLLIIKLIGLPFSLKYIVLSTTLIVIFLFLTEMVIQRNKVHTLAYIPLGHAEDLPPQIPFVQWLQLESPELAQPVTGIVADLHSGVLDGDWERFIAEQTLQGVPVYHHRHIRESLTGRVRIKHLYENELGSLLPSKDYMVIKYLIDVLLVLISLPLTGSIMTITALLIRLESPGRVLFRQKRVGQGGQEFIMYKFRSMCHDSEAQGAKMASENDMRVTRVGKFIRKSRIDELPQIFNVLEGNMSLIGPRPEQKVFVDQFEQTIPFYNYRHIVKPGISGWAQVVHGYADNEDETKIKVEHDFFYIKHFSFTLDLLIFFKTIHTMVTGFGAR